MLFCNTADRFYKMAHPNGVPVSSLGSGRCPFRAVLQAKSLHTTSLCVATSTVAKQTEDHVSREADQDHRSECKCVAAGLKPKG